MGAKPPNTESGTEPQQVFGGKASDDGVGGKAQWRFGAKLSKKESGLLKFGPH